MGALSSIQQSMAVNGLIYIVVVLVCVATAWWALQQFKLDLFVKNPRSAQSKVLQVLLSLALGYQVARFIIDYFNWSAMLTGLF
ncbi:DUF1146 family protein [Paenibacillus senegalensis]|uniref:DUF1146 family protein n=1 Tax=Paenibacillus senegalensis TaxID=1465766 RepID=UPI000289D588|nr:DUF1146 family protein [Paenibacillus senegalensis]